MRIIYLIPFYIILKETHLYYYPKCLYLNFFEGGGIWRRRGLLASRGYRVGKDRVKNRMTSTTSISLPLVPQTGSLYQIGWLGNLHLRLFIRGSADFISMFLFSLFCFHFYFFAFNISFLLSLSLFCFHIQLYSLSLVLFLSFQFTFTLACIFWLVT